MWPEEFRVGAYMFYRHDRQTPTGLVTSYLGVHQATRYLGTAALREPQYPELDELRWKALRRSVQEAVMHEGAST